MSNLQSTWFGIAREGNSMVSMKDISVACGVSVATVSKALNDHKDIGKDTKLRIQKAAKEMGYFPNSSARALKTNRTFNLGVLFADESLSGLTHDYFANVLDSFKVAAEEKGYDITFLNCSKLRKNRMSYLEHTRYRGLDGIVIACIFFGDSEVVELLESDLPIVIIDYLFDGRMSVASDNITGMKDLITYIYDKGHRKIAYIHGNDTSVTKNRLSSFYNVVEELGLHIPDEYIKAGAYRDLQLAAERTEELLDLCDPPTCIVYPDDYASIGGINAIKTRGLSVPGDISVAGYDGINLAYQFQPNLTTVKQDTKTIGKVAAEKLIDLIEKPKSTLIEQIIVTGGLVEGDSILPLI